MDVQDEMSAMMPRRQTIMKPVRFDPFLELAQRDVWVPPVDIFERQDQLVVRAEVPGMSREDMDVRVEGGVLTLQGQRKRETEAGDDENYRSERSFGAFTRSFSLPRTVDAAKVSAAYKDGILEVT